MRTVSVCKETFLRKLKTNQDMVECIYPALMHSQMTPKWNNTQTRNNAQNLVSSLFGVVSLGLSEIKFITQIGDNIGDDENLKVLVGGTKPDSKHQVIYQITIDQTLKVTLDQITPEFED